jgi:ketosteroid isomerase-like protein
MSAADVELIRNAFAAQLEGGYEALLPLVHPEFEMETLPGQAAEPQVYRGPDGVRRWWESFYEVMDEITIEPVAFHDVGEGRVVMEFRLHAKGQASGLAVTQEAVGLCHVRDGLFSGIDFFFSLGEALAAAGAERAD